jgi:MFS family permease
VGESDRRQVHAGRAPLWRDRGVVGVVVASFASGFSQFSVVAALGSVARAFGHLAHGATFADQAGLSGTTLGVGLALIRLSSLGALPLAGAADRRGRRRTLLVTVTLGLAFTVLAAASPGYWWFVAIFAAGRPLLTATNTLSEVIAAECVETRSRAAALALVAAGYGVGAGVTAIVHSLFATALGFRGLVALAVVPLALIPLVARWVREPTRFEAVSRTPGRPTPVLGAVGARFRSRMAVVVVVAFALSFVTGPANSFIFLDAQNHLHLSGTATAVMVVAAGVAGLAGLLLGRWLSDRWGRRATGALGMVGLGVGAVLAYQGTAAHLVAGYVLGILMGSVFAPAIGALVNELFPTTVRASAAGWFAAAGVLGAVGGLLTFGAIADAGHRFALAADLTFIPATLVAALFWVLPETRGRDLEDR